MSNQPQPQWQPISQLPLFTTMIDGILTNSEEQFQTFSAITDKPYVLDDDIVARATRLYTEQRDTLWL